MENEKVQSDSRPEEIIFAQEQAHLQNTYSLLKKMEKDLEARIASVAEKAAAEKLDIRENLALNFEGDSDSMETYIEFEVMNHTIDQYNIERDTAAEKLGRVRRLLKSPYFAKVQLRYAPGEDPEEYYIGSVGISENSLEPLVIDWRSPVAETYYNQENGRTHYTVDGRRIDVELLLRRQFELEENRLHAFFDTQIALSDPLLIRSLTRQRTDKMQAITATIQKEQNAVVRHENVPVLLVNGIAGSGKTSVLLQRIAWLFYRQRNTLRPDEVVLMTLNPIFRRYIDHVLPDMGELNPLSLTWGDFLSMAGVERNRGETRDGSPASSSRDRAGRKSRRPRGTTPETLRRMEENLPLLCLEPTDLLPVYQKNACVLSRDRIAQALALHPGIPTGERLVQITIDELKEITKREIRRKEREEEEFSEDASGSLSGDSGSGSDYGLSGDSGSGSRRKDGNPEHSGNGHPGEDAAGLYSGSAPGRSGYESAASRAEDNRIRSQYGGAFQAINTCQWLDIEQIGGRLLGRDPGERLSDIEWLYLKMLLTGRKDIRTKYVMVDEIQDYTPAQLMVLRKYYPRARFMLLGDEYQAIRESTLSFAQIHTLFEKSPVTELSLNTSYRSSPEITALFTSLLPPEKQILVSSVQPSGRVPVFHVCADTDSYARQLVDAIHRARNEDGLTAVLCAGVRSMEHTAALLEEYRASAKGILPQTDGAPALREDGQRSSAEEILPQADGAPA
ncbi:MAG: hypothetical protein Q4D81_12040, partial [Eubacteriales bacterium]|nr:hypothetical protein [Eubacteriales bacterium]